LIKFIAIARAMPHQQIFGEKKSVDWFDLCKAQMSFVVQISEEIKTSSSATGLIIQELNASPIKAWVLLSVLRLSATRINSSAPRGRLFRFLGLILLAACTQSGMK
jgi:hypothetical protein